MSDVLLETIKAELVKALFAGYSYYDNNGSYHTIKPLVESLIPALLEKLDVKDIVEALAVHLNENKAQITEVAQGKILDVLYERNSWGESGTGFRSEIRKTIQDVIAEILKKDPGFNAKVAKVITLDNVTVEVKVTNKI